jgi:hypothetical protein
LSEPATPYIATDAEMEAMAEEASWEAERRKHGVLMLRHVLLPNTVSNLQILYRECMTRASECRII